MKEHEYSSDTSPLDASLVAEIEDLIQEARELGLYDSAYVDNLEEMLSSLAGER